MDTGCASGGVPFLGRLTAEQRSQLYQQLQVVPPSSRQSSSGNVPVPLSPDGHPQQAPSLQSGPPWMWQQPHSHIPVQQQHQQQQQYSGANQHSQQQQQQSQRQPYMPLQYQQQLQQQQQQQQRSYQQGRYQHQQQPNPPHQLPQLSQSPHQYNPLQQQYCGGQRAAARQGQQQYQQQAPPPATGVLEGEWVVGSQGTAIAGQHFYSAPPTAMQGSDGGAHITDYLATTFHQSDGGASLSGQRNPVSRLQQPTDSSLTSGLRYHAQPPLSPQPQSTAAASAQSMGGHAHPNLGDTQQRFGNFTFSGGDSETCIAGSGWGDYKQSVDGEAGSGGGGGGSGNKGNEGGKDKSGDRKRSKTLSSSSSGHSSHSSSKSVNRAEFDKLKRDVAALTRDVTALKGTQVILGDHIHDIQHGIFDNVCIRETMNKGHIKVYHTSEVAELQPRNESNGTPLHAQNMLNSGQLGCMSRESLDLLFDKRPGSLYSRCNHSAHGHAPVAAQRDAIIRIADPAESLAMRLVFRFVYGYGVGTAAAALLARTEALQLAAGMSPTVAQTALEIAAEKAEAAYFQRNLGLLRFLSKDEQVQFR